MISIIQNLATQSDKLIQLDIKISEIHEQMEIWRDQCSDKEVKDKIQIFIDMLEEV